MNLVGFDENKMKFVNLGLLARVAEEENSEKKKVKETGHGGKFKVEGNKQVVLLAHSLGGKQTLTAVVTEYGEVYVQGTEIHVKLYDGTSEEVGTMFFHSRHRSAEAVANELARVYLDTAIMAKSEQSFVGLALKGLIKNCGEDINYSELKVSLQACLDGLLAKKDVEHSV